MHRTLCAWKWLHPHQAAHVLALCQVSKCVGVDFVLPPPLLPQKATQVKPGIIIRLIACWCFQESIRVEFFFSNFNLSKGDCGEQAVLHEVLVLRVRKHQNVWVLIFLLSFHAPPSKGDGGEHAFT